MLRVACLLRCTVAGILSFSAVALMFARPALSQGSATESKPKAFIHATIHDGTGRAPLRDGVIVWRGERIVCVGKGDRCPIPDGAETIDLKAQHVTPGLIDSHVHFAQTGWLETRPDQGLGTKLYDPESVRRSIQANPDRWHRAWLCSGITAVFDTGGGAWTVEHAKEAEHNPRRAHVRAAGPALQFEPIAIEGLFTVTTDQEAVQQVSRLASLGSQAIKLRMSRVSEGQESTVSNLVTAIGREAHRAGLPFIVHALELRTAKVALKGGADILIHSVTDEPIDDEFVRLIKARSTLYVTTLNIVPNWNQTFAGAALGTLPEPDDPNGCIDKETRARLSDVSRLRQDLRADRRNTRYGFTTLQRAGRILAIETINLRRLHREGVPIVVGTDSGNALTFHGPSIYAELEAVEAAGIPASEVLVMATRNGARAMKRTDIGTLSVGNVADMLVLKDDPSQSAKAFRTVQRIIRAGVVHRPSDFSDAPPAVP